MLPDQFVASKEEGMQNHTLPTVVPPLSLLCLEVSLTVAVPIPWADVSHVTIPDFQRPCEMAPVRKTGNQQQWLPWWLQDRHFSRS